MKRALVIGLGTLGRALLKSSWLEKCEVEAVSRSTRADKTPTALFDFTDGTALANFLSARKFDLVVNCAAMTDVDACEKSPEEARRVNASAVRALARAARASGADFIHLSTNYVFSGLSPAPYREEDPTDPCSIYGITKLEGEYHVLKEHPDACVVRTSWIFGGVKRDFLAHFTERFEKSGALEVVADQTASLTYAPDLAEAIGNIAHAKRRPRVIHVANRGPLTRYDMLVEMKKILGKANRIVKVPQNRFGSWAAVRPAQSALSVARYERAFGEKLRTWKEALREHLETREAACAF